MYKINCKEARDFLESKEFGDYLLSKLPGVLGPRVQQNIVEMLNEQITKDDHIIEMMAYYIERDCAFGNYLSEVGETDEPDAWRKRAASWIRQHKSKG